MFLFRGFSPRSNGLFLSPPFSSQIALLLGIFLRLSRHFFCGSGPTFFQLSVSLQQFFSFPLRQAIPPELVTFCPVPFHPTGVALSFPPVIFVLPTLFFFRHRMSCAGPVECAAFFQVPPNLVAFGKPFLFLSPPLSMAALLSYRTRTFPLLFPNGSRLSSPPIYKDPKFLREPSLATELTRVIVSPPRPGPALLAFLFSLFSTSFP